MNYVLTVVGRCLDLITDPHQPVFWLWWASVLFTAAKDSRRALVHHPLKDRIPRFWR
ncbi:hypothetical protein D3C80_1141990 [compost metagenome]